MFGSVRLLVRLRGSKSQKTQKKTSELYFKTRFCKMMRNHKQQCDISRRHARYLTRNNCCRLLWLMEAVWERPAGFSSLLRLKTRRRTHSLASVPFTCKWGIVSGCHGFVSALCERLRRRRDAFKPASNSYSTERGKVKAADGGLKDSELFFPSFCAQKRKRKTEYLLKLN